MFGINLFIGIFLMTKVASSADLHLERFEQQRLLFDSGEDHAEFNELHLDESSEIQFNNIKSLRIKNLMAKKSSKIKISKIASGDDSSDGSNGSDGAKVTLFIDEIDGDLIIESRGGDGGDGRNGRHGRVGESGARGRHAHQIFGIYFGAGSQGFPGQNGEPGEDGQDGGRGGHGGEVQLFFIEKTPDSSIFVDVQGGRGGRAGWGGLGGLGGAGGLGGDGNPRGHSGPMGMSGASGRSGRPGVPGESGAVSIFQVSRETYQCLLVAYVSGGELNECD
jgi:hypothetical protein